MILWRWQKFAFSECCFLLMIEKKLLTVRFTVWKIGRGFHHSLCSFNSVIMYWWLSLILFQNAISLGKYFLMVELCTCPTCKLSNLQTSEVQAYYMTGSADPHYGIRGKCWPSNRSDWRVNPTLMKTPVMEYLVDVTSSPFVSFIPLEKYVTYMPQICFVKAQLKYDIIFFEIWDTSEFGPRWDSNSKPSGLWDNH